MKAVFPFALVAVLLASGCVTEEARPCNAETCLGCCDPQGTCIAGAVPTACGHFGIACVACAADQACANGLCTAASSSGGGGGATGGGTGGGEPDAGAPPDGGPADAGQDAGTPTDGGTDAGACAQGQHSCAAQCVPSTSTASCGASCSPCAVPTNAFATCDGTACDFGCQVGFVRSGASCVAAPPASGAAWTPLAPLPRTSTKLAYDSARHVAVLFGGMTVTRELGDNAADTWEWDGASWTLRTPAVSPPPRRDHAMAYDAFRARLVLFGGSRLADTWEWDGTNWLQRTPATSPPPMDGHAMAWDAVRRRVVLLGGATTLTTWEWDGTTWLARPSAHLPPIRSGHELVYDAARQRVLLFGGWDQFNFRGDTWEWDGTDWTQRFPATSPGARGGHSMGYDPAGQRVLLYGGSDASVNQYSGETWAWNGTTWALLSPAVSPGPRSGHGGAFDSARGRFVLHGGGTGGGYPDGTWEFDGVTWVVRPTMTPPQPGARQLGAAAWDPVRQRVVLFGGNTPGSPYWANDTWEWDGARWLEKTPVTSPQRRYGHAMAWNGSRGRVVLFGGRYDLLGTIPLADTWEWDGTAWAQRSPTTSPPPRSSHALAWDPLRQRTVLFGGWLTGYVMATDTWEYDGTTWLQRTPATVPRISEGATMTFDSARGRVVLVGRDSVATGQPLVTWEWDGTNWTQLATTNPPLAATGWAIAFHPTRQRLTLVGSPLGPAYYDQELTWELAAGAWTPVTSLTSPPNARAAFTLTATTDRLVLHGGSFDQRYYGDTYLYTAP